MIPVRRLLHVFPNFNVGGAQMRFVALVDALGPGYSHSVMSLAGDFQAAKLLKPGAAVERCFPPSISGALPQRLSAYRAILRAQSPDLLLTYNWGAIEVALANMFGPTPHLHTEDGFGPEEAERQFARRIWFRRLALSRSHVVVPSLTLQEIARRTWRLNMRRVRYIPNGVAPQDRFATALGNLGLDLPDDAPRIVWAGALRREKNPLRLLRAFAPLKDRAVLLIIGDGPERAAVEAEGERLGLGSRLRLLGHRNDARDLIMQCQVLALSSDTEQMPLTVLEAMDAGLAVASVDIGDVRHMVAPENRPFIVPACEAALTKALERLVADAPLSQAIGKANQARLRDVYTLDGMVDAYASLFDQLISPARGAMAAAT